MISNVFNTWNSEDTSSNIVLVNQKVNHGNSEKYSKDKIVLWNDDKITEIILFI